MYDAIVAAIHEGLAGLLPLDEALMKCEQRRNQATIADYQENIARATFDAMPAKLLQLRAALRGNEEDTRRSIMAREGMIPPEQFFNPENMERILVNAEAGSVPLQRTTFLPELNHFTEAADNV